MIWFAVVLYLLLSPVVCLVIGRAIRMRNAERPVEQCEAEGEATPVAVAAQPALQTVVDQPEIPVAV